jgi:Vitamin K-dependent gamma-carboxylase
MLNKIFTYLKSPTSIAPLVLLRIAFGLLMFVSTLRFMLKGWVHQMYIAPKIYFPYYGFEWVKVLSSEGMYILFGVLLLTSLCIAFGLLYRISTIIFFLVFTYIELIDKTNYLNHYYFVSIIAFLLILVPAHRNFSLDNKIFNWNEYAVVPKIYILLFQVQMSLVYFFAGVAKVNSDWLLEAMPLKIWLPALSHLPIIGVLLSSTFIAFMASWVGCIYDLLIGFLLFNKRTSTFAYILVVLFHLCTALFFNIGMFPYIMICVTVIFLKSTIHLSIINRLKAIFHYQRSNGLIADMIVPNVFLVLLLVHFCIQIFMPFRYLLYDGNLFWHEQGYRFSWRVMLIEKAGTSFFTIVDTNNKFIDEVTNCEHLNYMQEKMMSTQPDMLLQYAHYLKTVYIKKGFLNPKVYVKNYVTLNGSGTRLFVNDTINLAAQPIDLKQKTWLLPFQP